METNIDGTLIFIVDNLGLKSVKFVILLLFIISLSITLVTYLSYSHQSEGNDSLDDNAVDPHSLSPRGDRDVPYITQSSVPNPLSR